MIVVGWNNIRTIYYTYRILLQCFFIFTCLNKEKTSIFFIISINPNNIIFHSLFLSFLIKFDGLKSFH